MDALDCKKDAKKMEKLNTNIFTQGMKIWKNVDFFTVCPLILDIEQQFRFSDVNENWKYMSFKKGIHPIVDGLC